MADPTSRSSAAYRTDLFDEQLATWRDRRGRPARWPDLTEATRFRMTRVVLAAAHLDSEVARAAIGDAPWMLEAADRLGLMRRLEAEYPTLEGAA